MVGTPRAALALLAASLFAAPGAGADEQLEAVGACRDGVPNGAWELYRPDGRLRAVGAFAQGKKTGTFIFWTGDGARIAVVPYNDDVRIGTVALWYTASGNARELRPKSEAPYVAGKPHGVKRSWYRSGARSAEARYEHGVLVEASAWSEAGVALSAAEAQARAGRERAADEDLYAGLDALVRDHPPSCG